ncbi:MAG TPA: hypothetical protein VF808_07655 [Ktedonobacterales bacterium]
MVSAAKWGAIVGVAVYIISQALYFAGVALFGPSPADPSHPAKYALGCVDLLIIAFAFSTSGFYAGRETRVAGLGAVAGMVTFVTYGLLLGVIPLGQRVTPGQGGATLGQDIALGIVTVGIYLGISALIGWLGGRPGATRGKADARQAPSAPK